MIKFNFCWFSCKLFIRNGIEVMTYVIDESRGDGRAHTHSLRVTINVFFLTKNSNWNEWFLASSEVNFGFKRQFIVFSTCENVDGNFESLGGRFHRNGRIRPIGRLGVTFLIGRLGVKVKCLFHYNFSRHPQIMLSRKRVKVRARVSWV